MRSWVWTANLSNSIVGVSVLAMPFCIQQCGLILGIVLMGFSMLLTQLSCGLLVRAAQISRRSSYEALALSTFGPLGKSIIEVSITGLQLGSCIAYYVIIGDLAPPAIAAVTGLDWSPSLMRTVILCASAVVIVLPLAMMKDVADLSSISIASLCFYAVFTVYLIVSSLPHVFDGSIWSRVMLWNINGVFKCIPIFALAFACHPQLLIIYDAHPDPTVSRMTSIITNSVHLIGTMYSLVAVGGYMTFFVDHIDGDILSNFYPTLFSQLIKLGFALSVVVSFPLVIFPCRVSINSLVSQIQQLPLEAPVLIPQGRFMAITIFITFSTLVVAILLPHIETVLALNGATAGSLISYVYPAAIFLSVTHYREEMRNTAKFVLGIGLIILMASTVSILVSNMDDAEVEHNGPIKYPWPQPKTADHFPALHKEINVPEEVEKPVDALQNVDEGEDKGGGADDSRVEQYPDQLMKDDSKKVPATNPSTSEQTSDATQETKLPEKDSDHKELISKLEVLEERVQKLESENQELKEQKPEDEPLNQEAKKVETESHDVDNHEEKVVDNHEEKVVDKPIAVNTDKKTDDAVKLNDKEGLPKLTSKDKLADLQLDKDKVVDKDMMADKDKMLGKEKAVDKDRPDIEGAHQPAVNSPPQANVQLKQGEKWQQPHVHDTSREDDKSISLENNPVQKHPVNTNTEKDQPRVDKTQVEKVNVDLTLDKQQPDANLPDLTLDNRQEINLPDILLSKKTVNEDAIHNAEKVPVLVDQETQQDENDRHQRNVDLPNTHALDLQLADQKLEQELPKLKTENVVVRSRDLLHSEALDKIDKSHADNENPKLDDLKTELHVDKMVGAAAPAAFNKSMIDKTTNSLKRNMLSLKQSDNNETHSLNNGG